MLISDMPFKVFKIDELKLRVIGKIINNKHLKYYIL